MIKIQNINTSLVMEIHALELEGKRQKSLVESIQSKVKVITETTIPNLKESFNQIQNSIESIADLILI